MSLENELLKLALTIARSAGDLLVNRPASWDLTVKSTAIDIATQMDHASEKLIVDAILSARPDDGIIGEEGAARTSTSGITWVIDPVDGTVNYFYGLPGWNISIAAKDSNGTIVGVVHAPTIGSTWHASRGGGAFLNGVRIECNDPVELNRALISTGFAYDVKDRAHQLEIIDRLVPQIRDIRRMGAAATDLCCVATGMVDGYVETGLKEWDLAAGSLIAVEAGAVVTTHTWRGMELTVAAGPLLHAQLRSQIPG
ncbi:MAG: inositol monophosphatase [Actinobacteria bacterium]|uniref:inositol-phosphate phosphatase n=1 Tax=freshwater metagenome TaxID=449393 RepID=A0A6J7PMR9_9ZZZZ|nr:inositol monophosphatase family protein [Actinomycetota bacterium]MSV39545.1 inositol monophosphatase [Actinomycetota bacterium]MSY49585.1 inositol monophosphatase [Actinomycetota bacterium]MTH91838.1 inositol monophosphatase [Actinomycetota bacterium]